MNKVLKDWIYLYYLNGLAFIKGMLLFLRIEFICIIWTVPGAPVSVPGS